MNMAIWIRNCPGCDNEITYSTKYDMKHAARQNTKCKKCRGIASRLPREVWSRNCPKCNKELIYSYKGDMRSAEKKGQTCRECIPPRSKEHRKKMSEIMKGKTHSKETKLKISEAKRNPSLETRKKLSEASKGRPSPMKGKTHSEESKKKIRKARAKQVIRHSDKTKRKLSESHKGKVLSEDHKNKLSAANLGKHHTNETRKKMRLSAIKSIEDRCGQIFPNYNPSSISIIEQYGRDRGYNFQHAENGGEHYIKDLGYWVDGYDKDKNVVIEYYETAHKKTEEHDKQRQQEIIDYFGCEFIIIEE